MALCKTQEHGCLDALDRFGSARIGHDEIARAKACDIGFARWRLDPRSGKEASHSPPAAVTSAVTATISVTVSAAAVTVTVIIVSIRHSFTYAGQHAGG